jgi:predicted nucleic acid-binding protein
VSFLLDTSVISELRKGERCHAGVLRWMDAVDDDELFLSVLTVGEIRRGIEMLRKRDPGAARSLERWLRELQHEYSARILGIDREVAEAWGRLSPQRPLGVVDGLLAATSLHHGMTLVTRNVRDFTRAGIDVLDPFSS